MRVSFYIPYPNSKRSSVICTVVQGKKRLRIGTGIVVTSKNWHGDEQRAKRNSSDEHYNARLDKIRGTVQSLFEVALSQKLSDPLAYVFDKIFEHEVLARPAEAPTSQDIPVAEVLAHYKVFIEHVEKRYKKNSYRIHLTIFNHFSNFIGVLVQSKRKKKLLYEDINAELYNAYVDYLFNVVGLTSNTVAMNIKKVKQFLNWSADLGLIEQKSFAKTFKWTEYNKPSTMFALSREEIKMLEIVDLSDSKRLDRVRDLFLIQLYTGLRFSDLRRLSPEHLQHGRIRIRTQKDGSELYLSITPPLARIIEKYPELNLPRISLKNMNAYLKEVGLRAGLTGYHTITRYNQKGEAIETRLPKHEALTTHAGRRTLITQSLIRGVPKEIVKEVTGHKSDASFTRYVRFAARDVADAMKEAWKE